MTKPTACHGCVLMRQSTGFVRDHAPELVELSLPTLFAVVLRFPTKEDLVKGIAWDGKMGRVFERDYLLPLGIRREQIIVTNTLRCYPHGGVYPTARTRTEAVKKCRQWDTALINFQPNIWGVTFDPVKLLATPNQATFMHRAVKRAKEWAEAGYRPCLLMGEEAKDCYAPWLQGGVKRWQGTWFLNEPYKEVA